MVVIPLVLIVLVVAAGLLFSLGTGLVAVVPLALAVAVGVWLVRAFVGRAVIGSRSGAPAGSAELLGPGGPDDPANTANHGV
jgi:hypothetical protein